MINIMSTYDPVGFAQLNASLAESEAAMTGLDAQSAFTMANMGSSTGKAGTMAEQNMGKASIALNQFELEATAAENTVTTGLTPAMMGMNTSKLEQMGVDMTAATGSTSRFASVLETIGPISAIAFGIVLAGLALFTAYSIKAAISAEKDWDLFKGAIGDTTPGITEVQSRFESLFTTIARGTGHSTDEIVQVADQLAVLGTSTDKIGEATNAVAVIGNVRFGGDMSTAVETYNKAVEGSAMGIKKLGINFSDLGYTSTQWNKLTKDQRESILDTYIKEGTFQKANDAYMKSTAGQWQTIKGLVADLTVQFGQQALDLLKTSGIMGDIVNILTWFDNNKGAQDWVIAIVGIGTAILGIVGTLWVLTKMKGMFDDVTSGVKGAMKAIGLLNDTPCAQKNCGSVGGSTSKGGGIANSSAVSGLAITAAAVYLTADIIQAIDTGQSVSKQDGGSIGAGITGFLGSFTNNLPLPMIMQKIAGVNPTNQTYIDQWHQGQGMGGAISSGITTVGQNIPLSIGIKDAGNLPASFKNATGQIDTEWNREMGVIKGAWSNTTSYLGSVWNRFLGQWNNNHIASVWGGLVAYIKGAWNNTVSFVDNGASNIYNAGANAFNGIYNAISGALGNAWVLIQNFVNNSVSDISKVGSSIESAAQSAANNVINSAGGDGTNLYAAGGDGTNLYTGSSSSNSSNVTHNHTWNIGTIGDKATADHVVQQVVNQFTKENDIRGA